ncbi:MAG: ATP-binding protein [Deltaproteobacteria bacterium]|nr:ATP-binding protein [Deltaproteobacteria bacterium]
MELKRHITEQVQQDLGRKMVFIGGPRQVGKTHFAIHLRPQEEFEYYNWDSDEGRGAILSKEFSNKPLIILDEIHKYRRWRNYLKGMFDAIRAGSAPMREILVTGSARLDFYRFGGDSLQGRYHYIRLLPLSFNEVKGKSQGDLETLFRFGGFPEPFLLQSEVETKRWNREYRSRFVREDLRDLERVQDLGALELLLGRLPDCVGSPLSLNSLREDLQVAHRTIANWVNILERLYSIFRVPPLRGPKIRAVKKEQKAYFYNWTFVPNDSFRFENLIAVHLLKYVYWMQDSQGEEMELRFFRDSDGREVDFVMVRDSKPELMVECKLSQTDLSPDLQYLSNKFPKARAFQVHLRGEKDYQTPSGIRVCSAIKLLEEFI